MELQRYSGILPVAPLNRAERRAQQVAQGVALAGQLEQVRQHGIASTTEFAMMQFVQVKRLQSDLEHLCPDAAEGLAGFAGNAQFAMLRSLQRFSHGVSS